MWCVTWECFNSLFDNSNSLFEFKSFVIRIAKQGDELGYKLFKVKTNKKSKSNWKFITNKLIVVLLAIVLTFQSSWRFHYFHLLLSSKQYFARNKVSDQFSTKISSRRKERVRVIFKKNFCHKGKELLWGNSVSKCVILVEDYLRI